MKGWVYVITNKAMPNLVKVGYSMKDPEIRAKEFDHTGAPHPYVVDYDILVEQPREIEQKVHSRLQTFREGKEWFRCSIEEAIGSIRAIVGSSGGVENFNRADRKGSEMIRQKSEAEERAHKASRALSDRIEEATATKVNVTKTFTQRYLKPSGIDHEKFLKKTGITITNRERTLSKHEWWIDLLSFFCFVAWCVFFAVVAKNLPNEIGIILFLASLVAYFLLRKRIKSWLIGNLSKAKYPSGPRN